MTLTTSVPSLPVDIAFVTVNYNTPDCVVQLTEFFDHLDVPFTFSFTIVDNNSRDDFREYLRSHAQTNYIKLAENIGYGCAINCGVRATVSKYVCVMNTDVSLNREALVTLWRFLEECPDVGVCAPRLTYPDGRDQGMVFHDSLFSFYSDWFAKPLAKRSKLKLNQAISPLKVAGVLGAFFVIRRSVMPQPTLFDEDFFFYYEDSALAHTLKNKGILCFVIPSATIIHIGGKSSSMKSVSDFYASRYLYLNKFYGQLNANLVYFLDRWRFLRKFCLYSLFSLVTASERLRSKQRYYKVAWDTVRMKTHSRTVGS
jgi:N-acetylglucosaminyl-diphospho-decaprenol L-rhamnosyltransferase